LRTIYFKKAKKEYQSLRELIEHFHSLSPTTYWADNNSHQCPRNRNRSIDDLLMMCNNYFPGTTVKDILTVIKAMSNGSEEFYYYFFVCDNIGKPVLDKSAVKKSWYSRWIVDDIIYRDSLGRECRNSEYTLDQLKEILEND